MSARGPSRTSRPRRCSRHPGWARPKWGAGATRRPTGRGSRGRGRGRRRRESWCEGGAACSVVRVEWWKHKAAWPRARGVCDVHSPTRTRQAVWHAHVTGPEQHWAAGLKMAGTGSPIQQCDRLRKSMSEARAEQREEEQSRAHRTNSPAAFLRRSFLPDACFTRSLGRAERSSCSLVRRKRVSP